MNQEIRAQIPDTIKETFLPAIIIKSFEQSKMLRDVPAAVSYIGKQTLSSFSPTSLVSSLNTVPGVKMEERSPGSYRLNIRGSTLRSPFGVRNVKIYFNDIPFTDPGGNSYFNQLGFYNFNSLEIIKGANNSVYGAGTGGVMLIESLSTIEKSNVFTEYSTGSYNLQNLYASLNIKNNGRTSKFGVQHQENEGYRDHSNLKRNIYSYNGLYNVGNDHSIKTTFLYGDLFYQTPGALTGTEFKNNPRSSRPSVGQIPGASDANTFVHQQMFLAGITYAQPVIKNIVNKTTLYGMYTEFRNPALITYAKNAEPDFGGRTAFNYNRLIKNGKVHADIGFEYQKGFTSVTLFKNINGNQDSLRTNDEINNRQYFLFAQSSVDFFSWSATVGASLNESRLHFVRFTPRSLGIQERTFANQIAPRIALMRKFKNINIYSALSKGFSPPTTSELLPNGGSINIDLNAEKAVNYELGIKATLWKHLYIDINAFTFSLKNTIVQRRNATAGDYYYNAGSTSQHGIETLVTYNLFNPENQKTKGRISLSYTLYDFKYNEFKQQGNDFSGNKLPSVPSNSLNVAFDVSLLNGIFGSINYYYSDRVPLNDANSEYASCYHLLSAKAGVEKIIRSFKLKLGFGADNLINETYSLGNDINAFGGRYYNAAPGRNFYLSLAVQIFKKEN